MAKDKVYLVSTEVVGKLPEDEFEAFCAAGDASHAWISKEALERLKESGFEPEIEEEHPFLPLYGTFKKEDNAFLTAMALQQDEVANALFCLGRGSSPHISDARFLFSESLFYAKRRFWLIANDFNEDEISYFAINKIEREC